MKEDFLHFLWRYQRFDWAAMTTTTGEPFAVLHPGEPNPHAGPDFLHARVRIDETLWAGNVEIHIRSSEWTHHKHHADPAYDNVVLHVVLEEDQIIHRANGERIPCLELRNRIFPGMRQVYFQLMSQNYWIPCQTQWGAVPALTKDLWVERLAIERLEQRTEKIQEMLAQNTSNWEETFYQAFARSLGYPANADPFEELARSCPLGLLSKKRNNLMQLEAFLFGQAGFLEGHFQDDYPKELQKEYCFLQKKHLLTPMQGKVWKFMRMRPANFPTLRIAQLARLVHQTNHLFDKAMSLQSLEELEHMLELKVSSYWRTHYRFDHSSPKQVKSLGKSAIHNILINAIAPLLFVYGVKCHNMAFMDRAMALLTQLPPEDNHVARRWAGMGYAPANAAQSQALLFLKKKYCDEKKCLHCAVGHSILKAGGQGQSLSEM